MRKIIIVILLFFTISLVHGQESGEVIQTIKGKVINETTNESVSYTNIGLEGTLYGTASTMNGDFELKIPEGLSTKNIFFSAVGYKNKTFPVSELFDENYVVIKLEPQTYDIGKIDVEAQSKVLIRILRMAAENIPYNYIGGPFNLVCNLEENNLINDSLQISQKANVTIFDRDGYMQPSKLNAFQSIKYAVKKDKTENDYRFSTGINNINELLEFDWVRSRASVLNPNLLSDFSFSLEDEPTIAGKEYWVITFKQSVPTLAGSGDFYASFFEGKITIEKDDYSVKEIEGNVRSDQNSLQGRSLVVNQSSIKVKKNVSYHFLVNYTNLKPESIQVERQFQQDGNKISEQINLKINQVQTTNLTALEKRDYYSGE